MTHGVQHAETKFYVDLNGEDSSTNVVSRSVAKEDSTQVFYSQINGNNKCAGHTECDAIIMDRATVKAIPALEANNLEASLIHEAAIGKDCRRTAHQADDTWIDRGRSRRADCKWILEISVKQLCADGAKSAG